MMHSWMKTAGSNWRGSAANGPAMVLTLAVASLLAPAAPAAMAGEAKGSKAHIAAVTKKVDGAFIRANEARTNDWPSHGLDYAETRF
jgi:quinohemoprotein ethanol dehydrogenase